MYFKNENIKRNSHSIKIINLYKKSILMLNAYVDTSYYYL